jgi:hypothetical protein
VASVIAYVLTRTANRPRMFARLRASLQRQRFPGSIVHVVHAEPGSDYAAADVVVRGARATGGSAPYELHQQRLLDAVASMEPGWVTFIDDDDEYATRTSLARMLARATDDRVMPVWKVERERGRISPASWCGDLGSFDGRLCWEAAAHHTRHIGLATIDANDGADGRYWHQLSQHLQLVWQDEVLTRPQVGKGCGRRRDY